MYYFLLLLTLVFVLAKPQRWLAKCPAKQIYISEYTQLPHTEVAFILGKKQSFKGKGKRREELLLRYVGDDHAKG